ncbi:nucleotidyltransferase domain-containing protein (plasmid) [Streptomyces sp. NBC_00984]|uniref:nucleotidyltransferase domain-containing protein n=1 Tax=Streptomyces sp. NBC_00984 TaxID=2903700 RepID=UPI002F909CC4|nr:nucleotidyltransferase domain-containing protein [Streptomyces sp. NBC_00984]
MAPAPRWKQLLDDRLTEAVDMLGAVPGVHGLIVGGSLGRDEPWPMSDIDLLPVYASSMEPSQRVEERRNELVDRWAASGHAQTLDPGWPAFTAQEQRDVLSAGPSTSRSTDPTSTDPGATARIPALDQRLAQLQELLIRLG